MAKPSFLVTNDDGIESPFLGALVRALSAVGHVAVVAPSGERSWIGKAITRRGQVVVRPRLGLFDCPAWEVDGTPADCVNLGLGNLVVGHVDAVVSGVNIGSNAGLPLILASGTVGAALEGALHGLHAIASSMRLEPADFATVARRAGETLPDHIAAAVNAAAARTAELCAQVARRRPPRRWLVHNLNFPPHYLDGSPLMRTVPALMPAGRLFAPVTDAGAQIYAFNFAVGDERTTAYLSDRACIEGGDASYSVLDFGRIGVRGGVSEMRQRKKAATTQR